MVKMTSASFDAPILLNENIIKIDEKTIH